MSELERELAELRERLPVVRQALKGLRGQTRLCTQLLAELDERLERCRALDWERTAEEAQHAEERREELV